MNTDQIITLCNCIYHKTVVSAGNVIKNAVYFKLLVAETIKVSQKMCKIADKID